MKAIMTVLVLATIFAVAVLPARSQSAAIRVPPNFGCASGRKDGLLRHQHVSACKGSWSGHVENAQLCSSGWHVCSWNDTEILSTVNWYEATHTDGCYAVNAAQNGGECMSCRSEEDHMAGLGADCPQQYPESQSCFGTGRIDASLYSATFRTGACRYLRYMSGVLCCRDKREGVAPTVTTSPPVTVRAPVGSQVALQCQVTGDPLPRVAWYQNDYPVGQSRVKNIANAESKVVSSTLTLSSVTEKQGGLYRCKAENKHGFAVSYSSQVKLVNPNPEGLVACRDHEQQRLLNGGEIAACAGKWKGTVRKATDQLCATGWHVCGLRDRRVLHELMWNEAASLSGCYAYDAATTDIFACTRCSRRNKGNSMSGVGDGCGSSSRDHASCLSNGRIDVWNSGISAGRNSSHPFDIGAVRVSSKRRSSCRYKAGITTGVICCKDRVKRRKGRKCKTPCGANSHCNKRAVCVCNQGFKWQGETCVARNRNRKGRKCAKISCRNGGRCRRGKCVCLPRFSGALCETGPFQSWSLLFSRG